MKTCKDQPDLVLDLLSINSLLFEEEQRVSLVRFLCNYYVFFKDQLPLRIYKGGYQLTASLVNLLNYSVIHISIHPTKELCSKMAPGEVGVSLP